MTTKEKLVRDREQANVAFLKLKQKYKPHEDKVYLVVEGKDDIAYYTCILVRYPRFSNFEIIKANSRKNVTQTYDSVDWTIFSPNRVFFFLDRDLSEITGEYTPCASNVYVTDYYSIENSLFNEQLFWVTLKVFYNLDDFDETEFSILSELYQKARFEHENAFITIMGWIVYWRTNKFHCNLNNLNSEDFFVVNQGTFSLKEEYKDDKVLGQTIHSICGVPYNERDISEAVEQIKNHGGIQKCIRGKYVRAFFVKFLNSVITSLPLILSDKHKPKAIVSIGQNNALQLLCGYMATPESLHKFLLGSEE